MKSILQFSLLDSMEVESFIQYVRIRMDIMLTEAKEKRPNGDYAEQEKIIEYLLKTQDFMNKIYEGNKFLVKESVKSASIITTFENENWQLKQLIEKQNKEIENLKSNIHESNNHLS